MKKTHSSSASTERLNLQATVNHTSQSLLIFTPPRLLAWQYKQIVIKTASWALHEQRYIFTCLRFSFSFCPYIDLVFLTFENTPKCWFTSARPHVCPTPTHSSYLWKNKSRNVHAMIAIYCFSARCSYFYPWYLNLKCEVFTCIMLISECRFELLPTLKLSSLYSSIFHAFKDFQTHLSAKRCCRWSSSVSSIKRYMVNCRISRGQHTSVTQVYRHWGDRRLSNTFTGTPTAPPKAPTQPRQSRRQLETLPRWGLAPWGLSCTSVPLTAMHNLTLTTITQTKRTHWHTE